MSFIIDVAKDILRLNSLSKRNEIEYHELQQYKEIATRLVNWALKYKKDYELNGGFYNYKNPG